MSHMPDNTRSEILAAFNQFAEFKRMAERMWLMLEEVCHMVDNGQSEGLQAKCVAVLPLWIEYQRFMLAEDAEPAEDVIEGPQVQLILDAGAAGVEPIEIRRRWLLMRDGK